MQLSVNTRAKYKSYVRKIKFITETLLTSFSRARLRTLCPS